MKREEMKEYGVIAALGAVGFAIGYFVSQYIHGRIYDHMSSYAALVLINTIGFLLGVLPVTLYLERTRRYILKAALITVGLVGSWFITIRLWPIVNAALMEHVGVLWFRSRGPFLNPALFVNNGLWSAFFAVLILLFRQVKGKDILLVTALFFLVLMFSMEAPLYFDLSDVGYGVCQRCILGSLFSLLVRRFFVVKSPTLHIEK